MPHPFASFLANGWETSAANSPSTRAFLVPGPKSLIRILQKTRPQFAYNYRPSAHNNHMGCLHPGTSPNESRISSKPGEMQDRT